MYTNVPSSSQLYGDWTFVGNEAVCEESYGSYPQVEGTLDEASLFLNHSIAQQPFQQLTQSYDPYSCLYNFEWYDDGSNYPYEPSFQHYQSPPPMLQPNALPSQYSYQQPSPLEPSLQDLMNMLLESNQRMAKSNLQFQQSLHRPQFESLSPYQHPASPSTPATSATLPSPEPSLEDLMKQIANSNLQYQQKVVMDIQGITAQLSQLTSYMSQSSAQPQSQPTPSYEETTLVEPSLELAREMDDDSSNVVEEVIETSIDDGHYVLEQLTETPHETFAEETLDISSTSDTDSIATNFVVDWPTDSEPLEPLVRVTVPAPTPFEDLVCAENATKFGCLRTSISLEEPLSDLLIEFPELAAVDTSTGFTCADCEGDFICPVCAEIEACLGGDSQILEDFEVVADIQRVELVETSNVEPTQPLPSIVLPSADETSTIGLECVHTPILRRFEYAYLENDVQLQTICGITDEFLQSSVRRCLDYARVKKNSCLQADCFIIVEVFIEKMLRPSTMAYQGANSEDDDEFKITLWDPGGGRRCKPWWEFLDQFKYKPP